MKRKSLFCYIIFDHLLFGASTPDLTTLCQTALGLMTQCAKVKQALSTV
jgi:hypothetical protein